MRRAALFVCLLPTIAGCSSAVHRSTPANAHILEVGELSTGQIQSFTKLEREAEGFSVHADADEHSRMLFLKPDLVGTAVHDAPAVIGHEPADLVLLARKPDWPGYFGTPAIANVAAGRRKVDGLAAAAVDAALKALDGRLPATAPRVVDQDAADPVFEQVADASLEHDRQVEKNEMDWLAAASRAANRGRR
jgi:hypothetical protein